VRQATQGLGDGAVEVPGVPAPVLKMREDSSPPRRSKVPESPPALIVVGPSPPPFHGVSVMTLELISALRELRAFAGHLDTRDPRPVATIGRLDVKNLSLGLRHAWRLHRMLGRLPNADVYLPLSQGTWGFLRDAVFVGLARIRRRRLYLHLHGSHLQEFTRRSMLPMRALIRLVLSQAHQAWALTPSLCSQFDGLTARDRVRCMENVVDDAFAHPTDFKRRGDGSFRVLYLSNLLPEKGVGDLIAALRELGEETRFWNVRLVGEATGEATESLLQEIGGLPDGSAAVELIGPRHGVAKRSEYAWADAFVFPARQDEGQPLVLLEAMCAGLAIVATRQSGIEDTIDDGVEGLLIGRRDSVALAAALTSLARDVRLRDALGASARRRYERSYRPERLMRDLTEVLEARDAA
jgi:glycosyltransferase involved in cell wall biosynthesis